jgi:putative endonuclease
MAYHVYILQSLKDSKYYIGSTSDVEARLRFHNAGLQRSTRNTVSLGLTLTEIFQTSRHLESARNSIRSESLFK